MHETRRDCNNNRLSVALLMKRHCDNKNNVSSKQCNMSDARVIDDNPLFAGADHTTDNHVILFTHKTINDR